MYIQARNYKNSDGKPHILKQPKPENDTWLRRAHNLRSCKRQKGVKKISVPQNEIKQRSVTLLENATFLDT